jgi:hypothetical protein
LKAFFEQEKGKGEKIFIYLDWTARKIEGKGGRQQSFKKKIEYSCRKNYFNYHTVVSKILKENAVKCVCKIKATVYEPY